jgi:hypothetical protein
MIPIRMRVESARTAKHGELRKVCRARRLVEQLSGQRPLGLPQRQPPHERLEQQRLSACPELMNLAALHWSVKRRSVRDQTLRPALHIRVNVQANRKGPKVLVAAQTHVAQRTLFGCSVERTAKEVPHVA